MRRPPGIEPSPDVLMPSGEGSPRVPRSLAVSADQLELARKRRRSRRDVDSFLAAPTRAGEDARAGRPIDGPRAGRDGAGGRLADIREPAKDQHARGDDDPPYSRVRPAAGAAGLN